MTALLLTEHLRQRVRLNGSAPLFTFYDLESGARTELSATTFSNWVDKTSNLLVDEVAVVVTGRHWQGYPGEVFACALHPLGFGFGEPLPDGVRDYATEVRSHADRYFGGPPDPDATAWVDRERTLSQADLVTVDGPPLRRLVRAGDPWTTCRDGIASALVSGGSAVVVVGGNDDQVTLIAANERATA
jgi:hypothetical protein